MKKRTKRVASKRKASVVAAPHAAHKRDRRKALRTIRNVTIGTVLLTGGSVFAITSIRKTMAEFDLTQIGQGAPSIVQIHDPNCNMCRNLQKNTRRALRQFDDGEITYLVANISTKEGQAFAARYGVAHVTLLLFDAAGNLIHVEQGVQTKGHLVEVFADQFAL
ncbi:MAG: hypothetical protein AAF198_00350 [Pseudomonadota bacterium]